MLTSVSQWLALWAPDDQISDSLPGVKIFFLIGFGYGRSDP